MSTESRFGGRAAVLAWVVLLAAALAGCEAILGPTPLTLPQVDNALPDTPRNLPTHLDGASMLAELRGVLRADGGCLWIVEGGIPRLAIWPSDFWLDGEILRSGREAVATVDRQIRVIGGNLTTADVRGRLTNPIPEDCLQDHVFWVGGVASE